MKEIKPEVSPEQQAIIGLSIILAGGAIIGVLLTPLFDAALAVSFNHTMISFLPDSFDSLKFTSNESEVFQKGQLIFANLPLLPVVLSYCLLYFGVLRTANSRHLLKTVVYLLGIYTGFYAMGSMVSQLLTVLT